jgi:hypothetical protein
VKDPDGWDLQVSNGKGLKESRDAPARANLAIAAPFAPTGWKTVWIDHLSLRVTKLTYDEGSQRPDLLNSEVGNFIRQIRGEAPPSLDYGTTKTE